jgi:hypothetical protein
MNRPKIFTELPRNVLESILNNCELEYDPYEGSRIEEIERFLNGSYDDMDWHINYRTVQDYYENLSDEEFLLIVTNNIAALKNQLDSLIEYKNKLTAS